MTIQAPFDRLATTYDDQWTDTPIGQAQRNVVWRYVMPLFHPGERLLDIGCGTGADAAHFSSLGVIVTATDPSPAMIEQASQRGGFTAKILSAERLPTINEKFDGAMSNFGALNCVDDLAPIASSLATLVRPGGHLAICTIGRCCAWEILYYAAHLQFRKAFRRFRGPTQSSVGVIVRYPTVAELRTAFSDFDLTMWVGVGVLVPPSYVHMPAALVRACAVLDRVLICVPGLRALADHRLLIFARKHAA